MIAIIDYDIGNLAAVGNMLNRMSIRCQITSQAETIRLADKIILPGNGAFDACMSALRATGLVPLLESRVLIDRIPFLGICVGAQMLGHGSEEGSVPGLGWIDMNVKRFPNLPGLRVPHMGWSYVKPSGNAQALVQDMEEETRFYFVHSYYMEPANPDNVMLTSHYGIDFAAAVYANNIAGVQFHPEKSHRFGKKLLARFANAF